LAGLNLGDLSVSVYAGLPGGSGLANGSLISSLFAAPEALAKKNAHSVLVADPWDKWVRLVDTQLQTVSLFAPALRPYKNSSLAYDSTTQSLFIADFRRNQIFRRTPEGVEIAVAGKADHVGSTDGVGESALFHEPTAIAVGTNGSVFVAECGGQRVREVLSSGSVSTVAVTSGTLGCLQGVAVDSSGVIYAADQTNFVIWKILPDGNASVLAGTLGTQGDVDGPPTIGQFRSPGSLSLHSDGDLYVTDEYAHTIRRVDLSTGEVSTVAGTAGVAGFVDAAGVNAQLDSPRGLTTGPDGALYFLDRASQAVRRVTSGGLVSTLAGGPHLRGLQNGPLEISRLDNPFSMTSTPSGVFYIIEAGGGIRMLVP
jgi:sugar lactone lactonase YvrE